MSLTLRSTRFDANAEIPIQFTAQGADRSPPLAWAGVPPGTRSLALIVDDPDAPDPRAPKKTWVHWVLFNLPPTTSSLPEGVRPTELPAAAHFGVNDWHRADYGGPNPPIGRHRYVFKLYALDTEIALERPTKQALEHAMAGHVLDRAELVGTYEKRPL